MSVRAARASKKNSKFFKTSSIEENVGANEEATSADYRLFLANCCNVCLAPVKNACVKYSSKRSQYQVFPFELCTEEYKSSAQFKGEDLKLTSL